MDAAKDDDFFFFAIACPLSFGKNFIIFESKRVCYRARELAHILALCAMAGPGHRRSLINAGGRGSEILHFILPQISSYLQTIIFG